MNSEGKIPAKLESRKELAQGLAIYRLSLERDFHFESGQYATLWLTHRGVRIPRPYSIASSPSETRALELYINLVREGRLTTSLWNPDVLKALESHDPDTELFVTGPKGRFILDSGDHRDLVFVASGTGLAPFISMIRKLNEECAAYPKTFAPRRIYVIHGASLVSHLGYRDELERLTSETLCNPGKQLKVIYLPTISRPQADASWHGLTGRAEGALDSCASRNGHPLGMADAIRGILAINLRPESHAVYVSGHPGTVDQVLQILSKRGFRPDIDVKREKYYT